MGIERKKNNMSRFYIVKKEAKWSLSSFQAFSYTEYCQEVAN